jgi:hypothetical protein
VSDESVAPSRLVVPTARCSERHCIAPAVRHLRLPRHLKKADNLSGARRSSEGRLPAADSLLAIGVVTEPSCPAEPHIDRCHPPSPPARPTRLTAGRGWVADSAGYTSQCAEPVGQELATQFNAGGLPHLAARWARSPRVRELVDMGSQSDHGSALGRASATYSLWLVGWSLQRYRRGTEYAGGVLGELSRRGIAPPAMGLAGAGSSPARPGNRPEPLSPPPRPRHMC